MITKTVQNARHMIAATGLMLVAACAQVPATSPNIGPAAKSTSPAIAGRLFAEVCLRTFPSFANAPATLAASGFVQNSRTGTYYLPNENLSVKLLDQRTAPAGAIVLGVPANPDTCSLVFGTNVPVDSAVPALAAATASTGVTVPPNISVTSRPGGADRRLFNLRISAN